GAKVGDCAGNDSRSRVDRSQSGCPALVEDRGSDPALRRTEPGGYVVDRLAEVIGILDEHARRITALAICSRDAEREIRPDGGEFVNGYRRRGRAHTRTWATLPGGGAGIASGCSIHAMASTPSTRRGPGRTMIPSASIAQTGTPGIAFATPCASSAAPARW